jgi:peptidoglycan L-alanyl-D-glutamate endopeptidase CwlK
MADDPASAPIDWGRTPTMDSRDFHDEGGQRWRYDATGVFLANAPDMPLRSDGAPATVNAILSAYGTEIFSASVTRKIPPELIVMTIAVEAAAFRTVNFTGPKTFRWEQGVTSYSGGPMQILESTAKDVIAKLHLVFAPEDIPPHFSSKPALPPSDNPLYDGDTNITLGTDYISMHTDRTGLDPILVAANYNAGSVRRTAPTADNPWGLVTFGMVRRCVRGAGAVAAGGAARRRHRRPGDHRSRRQCNGRIRSQRLDPRGSGRADR